MANISRYRPVDDAFDDLFRGFFMHPVRFEGQPDVQIKMDVKEDEKAYSVHAEIPGVKKEDIHVTVEGGMVAISAEVRQDEEEKDKEGKKVIRSERYFGKVSRSFSLPQDIDDKGVSAKYADGILELVLPKRTESKSTRIEIE